MREIMNDVIARLSGIEDASVALVNQAEQEKLELSKQIEEEKNHFQQALQEETKKVWRNTKKKFRERSTRN